MMQDARLARGSGADEGAGAEALLLARLKAGDPASCEALVTSAGPQMMLVARRLLGREEEAQQAVKDAFVSVFLALDRFDGRTTMATWLRRSVVNACLMTLRARPRAAGRRIEELLPAFLPDGHQSAPARAWRSTADGAWSGLTRRLIDELPAPHAEVLLLRDGAGLDEEDAAAILGLDAGTHRLRLRQARQALREMLDEHARAPDA